MREAPAPPKFKVYAFNLRERVRGKMQIQAHCAEEARKKAEDFLRLAADNPYDVGDELRRFLEVSDVEVIEIGPPRFVRELPDPGVPEEEEVGTYPAVLFDRILLDPAPEIGDARSVRKLPDADVERCASKEKP